MRGRQGPAVDLRELSEHALLVAVDSGLGGVCRIALCPSLDLDEAEGVVLPRDQIEISARFGTPPAARDDNVALAAQGKEGFALTALAEQEMWWTAPGPTDAGGKTIDAAQHRALHSECGMTESREGSGHRCIPDPVCASDEACAQVTRSEAACGGREHTGRRIRLTVNFTPGSIASLVIAASFAAGLNVYATVLTLGLLERLHWVSLPPGLDSHKRVQSVPHQIER